MSSFKIHARNIGICNIAKTAESITIANEENDTECFIIYSNDQTGNHALKTNSDLIFDSSTGNLISTSFEGALNGNGLIINNSQTVDMGNNRIQNVTDPIFAQEVATKSYVDATAEGLHIQESCRLATTQNITLSGEQTIDSVSAVAGDRILVKDQSNETENGVYVVSGGSWTRSLDFNDSDEIKAGDFVFITEGTVNGSHGYVMTTTGTININTTPITWTQFSGAGQIVAGDGLYKNGQELNVDLKADGGLVIDIESTKLAVNLAADSITGTLAVANGGTGLTELTDNSVLITQNSGSSHAVNSLALDGDGELVIGSIGGPTVATLTAGSNITITNGPGTIEIASSTSNADTVTNGVYTTDIGSTVQAYDADLSAIAGLISDADKGIQFTGPGNAATFDLTLAGKALLADADAVTQRTTLGLGTISIQDSDNISITDINIQGKIKNDLVIGEDSDDLLVVNSNTTFTENVNINGNIVIDGNFKVDGETTYVNTNILTVDDKNIELGSVASPDNTTANGGGIILKGGTSDKTILWDSLYSNWTSSEHINIVSGKNLKINNVSILNATTLGSSVVSSSLTSVGTIGTGTWQGVPIADYYINSASTWNGKQNALTFNAPSSNNNNPSTSAQIKSALDTKQNTLTFNAPSSNNNNPSTSAQIKSALDAKQNALTFGISDENAVKIDSSNVTNDEYARFTDTGLESRNVTEIKTDLSLNNVENSALSAFTGTANINTLGTITSGIWQGAPIAVNQGGTGAITDSAARTNLGLGNVENTADADKPVSTAQQTALNLKAPIANPTFTGNVGIGDTDPGTQLQISGSAPYLTLKNTTAENTEGGCESKILFEDHSNETLAQIQASHDGTASDNKGDLIFFTNSGTGNSILAERMRIDSSGNVGIGTDNPQTLLHISSGTDGNCVLRLEADTDNSLDEDIPRIEFVADSGNQWSAIFNQPHTGAGVNDNGLVLANGHQNGGIRFKTNGAGSSNYAAATEKMIIKGSGNVGIGTTSPVAALHVKSSTTNSGGAIEEMGDLALVLTNSDENTVVGISIHPTAMAFSFANTPGQNDSASHYTLRAYLSESATVNNLTFTGQHRIILNENINTTSKGLIVSSTGKYINLDNSLNTTINESLPICNITNIDNDKKVFGVISDKEDTNDNRTYDAGAFVTPFKKANKNEQRMFINSLGEGAVWICNKNGNIENGDYISSSSVPGYGMKQTLNEEVLTRYTVAKITCDCDFSLTKIAKQKLKVITTTETYEISLTQDIEKIKTETKIEYDETLSRYVQKEVTTTTTEQEQLYDTFNLYNESGEVIGTHQLERKETKTKTISNIDYDANGDLQYEDDLDADGNQQMIYPFETRFLLQDATQITEEEYNTKLADDESVYLACFVGCTYHCG